MYLCRQRDVAPLSTTSANSSWNCIYDTGRSMHMHHDTRVSVANSRVAYRRLISRSVTTLLALEESILARVR